MLHKYKKEYGKPYNRVAFYLSLKTDLFKYKLHALKEAMFSSASSGSDSEGTSQYKKLKTEPNSHRPSMDERRKPDIQVVVPDPASTLSSPNTELEQILEQKELKPTEQIATDAAIPLALQMENVDNICCTIHC